MTGYGPQESDCISRKEKFWDFLDKEVHSAKHDKVGIIIEIDSNAWAGKKLIPNDPNTQNNNGKLLEKFLNRNKNMTLVNSLPICEGLITRKRQTKCLNEKSILDLFIVCDQIMPYVVQMHVDEKGENQLTNFHCINHRGKVTETEHSKVELKLDLRFEVNKPHRTESFNFKNDYNKEFFKTITTNTNRLSNCLKSNEPFQKQIKKWEHELRSHVVKAFPKIRSRKRKFQDTEVGIMLESRKRIKLQPIVNEEELASIEEAIARKTSEKFYNQIKETMGHLKGDDGALSHHGVWKARGKLFSNGKEGNPIALKDKHGNLVTNEEGIKKLCLEEILERLRHRKIHPNLKELQTLKETLCQKRLDLARHIKSEPWSMKQLEDVLNRLKNKIHMCQDPHGYVNELFKYEAAGTDLKKSLLHVMNKTKDLLEVPDIMKTVNVVMIPKPHKSCLHNIQNQRGIFLLSVFRSILMKMLLKDEYAKINSFMSDSNVGGRKGRRAQDHLFIINGIIFDHARSQKKQPILIMIYDAEQCFDSLWQEEVINNLYEAGIRNDKLALL